MENQETLFNLLFQHYSNKGILIPQNLIELKNNPKTIYGFCEQNQDDWIGVWEIRLENLINIKLTLPPIYNDFISDMEEMISNMAELKEDDIMLLHTLNIPKEDPTIEFEKKISYTIYTDNDISRILGVLNYTDLPDARKMNS